MKKTATLFLQGAIVLIGLAVFTFLLWEPQLEGRNAGATLFEIYFKDPFLAYAYVASIPFFFALSRAFKVLGDIGNNNVSQKTVKALQTIKYCAMTMIGFVVGGEIWIMLAGTDDRPPAIFMGILITLGAIAMATIAAKFEKMFAKSN